MVFSSNYTEIYKQYQQKINITIDGVNNSLFNYNITYVPNSEMFLITFNMTCSITKYPFMNVNLNPPFDIISKYDIKLSIYLLKNRMQFYYFLTLDITNMINFTTQIANSLNGAISSGFMLTNIFSFSSSLLFFFVISIDKIRFLRYFEIKYPENVISIFTTKYQSRIIFQILKLKKTPTQRFFKFMVYLVIFSIIMGIY